MQNAIGQPGSWWQGFWSESSVALAVLGADHRYRAVNPACCRLLGADEATLLGWSYERIGHPLDLDAELDALVRIASGAASAQYSRRFRPARGAEFAAMVELCAAPDGILQRVQPLVGTPAPAVDALPWQRLAELGGALSHDAQEPVRMASVHLSLIEERLASGGDIRASLASATAATARVQRQLRALVDYARLSPPACDGSVALATLIEAARALLPMDAQVAVNVATDGTLRCDARQVALALAQLLGNAATFTLPGTPAQAVISLVHADGMSVLSVADNGRGIEPRDQAHLFRLFATGGRGPEYGAGVGLALCRAVAEGHGGRAWLESAAGRGTTVRLSFAEQ